MSASSSRKKRGTPTGATKRITATAAAAPVFQEDLTDVQSEVAKLQETLNARYTALHIEVERLKKDRADFDATHQEVQKFKDPVKLCVGGEIFMTSKTTLAARESMLRAMFSGRHTQEALEDGSFFIDRDPKHFGKILNFLRDGELVMEDSKVERREILKEAEYYCMDDLIDLLADPPFAFDRARSHANVQLNNDDARASTASGWCTAIVGPAITEGTATLKFLWESGSGVMFGVAPSTLNVQTYPSGFYGSGQANVYHHAGTMYGSPQQANLGQYQVGSIVQVTVDMASRTAAFHLNGVLKYTALNLPQAGVHFVVDLTGAAVSIVKE